ncbi:MAG: DUF4328 domain-containing protein [Planctomycetes bacterium]|nr:DUF4328 domain-containing protein [Planctomycetota bacterium]
MGPQLYIGANNQAFGPYDFAHVQAGVRRGEIQPQHMLSYDGRQWFPAQAIWPQLLGQAGFGPQQPAAHPQAAPQQPVAQARQVLQAQAVATRASSVPPGVALAAQTVTDENSEYSLWPGRLLSLMHLTMLVSGLCIAAVLVILKLPLSPEFQKGRVPQLIAEIGTWLRLIGLPGVYLMTIIWSVRSSQRLHELMVVPSPYSTGWTIAAFLLPVWNVFAVPVMLQRLWKSSDWAARNRRRPQRTAMIPISWALIVVCSSVYAAVGALPRLMIRGLHKDQMGLETFKLLAQIHDHFVKALPVTAIVETVAWGLTLGLFLAFDSRVRTRVEMG